MSYLTIDQCANDRDMQARIRAAWAQEGADASTISPDLFWSVAAAADIEAAYASALAADNPAPGADESVISDAMILGVVQSAIPDEAPGG